MLLYAQLQQMDGKIDNSRAQHLPQTELVACPQATQCLWSIQLEKLIYLFLHFTIRTAAARRNWEFNRNWQSHLAEDLAENLVDSQLFSRNLVESQLILAENLAKVLAKILVKLQPK